MKLSLRQDGTDVGRRTRLHRFRPHRLGVGMALALLAASCGSSSTVDLESLGLDIQADIQAGSQFEVAVPARPGVTVELVSAPAGVAASVFESADGASLVLSIAVEADTPRGAYNLALRATEDGDDYELGWPFDVVENRSFPDDNSVGGERLLTVDSPGIGAVFPSPSRISGTSSTGTVGYLLIGGGETVLVEGTLDVIDGAFSTDLEFTNDCCIEMQLEVFQLDEGGLSVNVPLAYPER